MHRLDVRLPGLDATERDEVQRSVRRIVEKLLHAPTVRVQELRRRPRRARLRRRPARAVRARPADGRRRDVARGPRVVPSPVRSTGRASGIGGPHVAAGPGPGRPGGGLLAAIGVTESTFVGVTTAGDRRRRAAHRDRRHRASSPSAVREALRAARSTVAVHSLKDLPTAPAAGLRCSPSRPGRTPATCWSAAGSADLPDGARIGTGAPRRAIQLLELGNEPAESLSNRADPRQRRHPDRAGQAGACDAVLLAAAGLRRLGHLRIRWRVPTKWIPLSGAYRRRSSTRTRCCRHPVRAPWPWRSTSRWNAASERDRPALDDPVSRAESLAERAFLATLEAGCTAPVGARVFVKSVRGISLDLTLTAVIGRTF